MDIITQMEESARRRKLLDAMNAQTQNTPLVGKDGGKQAMMHLLSNAINMYSRGKLDEQDAENKKQYSSQLGQETNSYLDRMSGKPGQVMTEGQASALMNDNQDPGLLAEPIQRNPREAVTRALTSNLPEMQRLGQAGMAGLGKETLSPKDLLSASGYSPESRVKAAQSGSLGDLLPEAKTHIVNGRVVRDTGNSLTTAGDFRERYGPDEQVGGETIQRELSTGKAHQVANRPAQVRVNNSPTFAGQKAGFEEWSKSAAKTVGELAEQARSSTKILSQTNQMEALNKAGTVNGQLAPAAVFLGQLSTSVGIPLTKDLQAKLSNSETFGNTAAELWLATMNANGGSRGLVKEESERIANNLPALVQTPEGRAQIIAVMRQGAQQNIADAKTAQAEYGKALQTQDPGAFTYGLSSTQLPNTVPNPAAPGSVAKPSAGVRSWKDYLGGR